METGTLHVAGCAVRWWADGAGGPTLVLTHGGAAHSGWWGPVLPRLVARQRVIWLDFSGHGESGHRADGYATTTWADEVAAVIREVAGGSAVVVAHSMGARIGALTAARHPDAVEALVTVDALVPVPADDPNIPVLGPPKLYPSREAAVAAFRLVPGQPEPAGPGVLAAIAEQAVGPSEGGWAWRFDRRIFECVPEDDGTNELIGQIRCPVVAVQGALSEIAHPGLVADFASRLGRAVPLVTIPGAHHHVTLDAPDAVADVLGWLPETRPLSARA
jgi:pimeloyl-ACP methyl ester carboxylesterase